MLHCNCENIKKSMEVGNPDECEECVQENDRTKNDYETLFKTHVVNPTNIKDKINAANQLIRVHIFTFSNDSGSLVLVLFL